MKSINDPPDHPERWYEENEWVWLAVGIAVLAVIVFIAHHWH